MNAAEKAAREGLDFILSFTQRLLPRLVRDKNNSAEIHGGWTYCVYVCMTTHNRVTKLRVLGLTVLALPWSIGWKCLRQGPESPHWLVMRILLHETRFLLLNETLITYTCSLCVYCVISFAAPIAFWGVSHGLSTRTWFERYLIEIEHSLTLAHTHSRTRPWDSSLAIWPCQWYFQRVCCYGCRHSPHTPTPANVPHWECWGHAQTAWSPCVNWCYCWLSMQFCLFKSLCSPLLMKLFFLKW